MTELSLYRGILVGVLALAAVVLLSSLFITAPYGRYARPRWAGPDLPSWLGWMLMELPQPAGLLICFALGERHRQPVALVLLGLWCFHYTYRTFIYPFLPRASTMSLSVVSMGFALNVCFSYLNGRWLFHFGPQLGLSWLLDPRFLIGVLLFVGGFALHSSSDAILRRLRAPGEKSGEGRRGAPKGYKIPRGGGYALVSCPNYLGELLQWSGWTLCTWSLAGLCILAVSAANLVPRARLNHRWYREHLPGYPAERRALIPYLW
jgi:3-oxo-5-alpha-steroid 4-dehydrogenase 1